MNSWSVYAFKDMEIKWQKYYQFICLYLHSSSFCLRLIRSISFLRDLISSLGFLEDVGLTCVQSIYDAYSMIHADLFLSQEYLLNSDFIEPVCGLWDHCDFKLLKHFI